SVVKYYFFKRKERAKTYTGELFQKLNVGFFITIMFIIFSMNIGLEPMKGFPLLIGLYGFWILIYGTALDFKPSIIAAYITWALGFAAFFVNSFATTMI